MPTQPEQKGRHGVTANADMRCIFSNTKNSRCQLKTSGLRKTAACQSTVSEIVEQNNIGSRAGEHRRASASSSGLESAPRRSCCALPLSPGSGGLRIQRGVGRPNHRTQHHATRQHHTKHHTLLHHSTPHRTTPHHATLCACMHVFVCTPMCLQRI